MPRHVSMRQSASAFLIVSRELLKLASLYGMQWAHGLGEPMHDQSAECLLIRG
jgi:hypothetical protein